MPRKKLPYQSPCFVIYMLVAPNGKYYIGMTTQGLEKRWKDHISESVKGKHFLSRAIRKYGPSRFEKSELMRCTTLQEMRDTERLIISALRSYDSRVGYNIAMGGEGVIPNEELRQRIIARTLGHPVSAETREKLRIANLGKRGRFRHTPESLAKIRAARLRNNPGGFKTGESRHTAEQRERARIRMRNANPMKRSEVVAKVFANKRSPEHCLHISQAKKGKKVPKLSLVQKGRIPWNKGKRGSQVQLDHPTLAFT